MYPSFKTRLLTKQFGWTTDDVIVVLVASGLYTPSINHATLLDVPVSARVASSGTLTGKTVSVNVVDADDYLFTTVSGPVVSAALLVASGTDDASSYLICHLDDCVSGIPFTPATLPARLTWNNGANKIFAL